MGRWGLEEEGSGRSGNDEWRDHWKKQLKLKDNVKTQCSGNSLKSLRVTLPSLLVMDDTGPKLAIFYREVG